MNDEISKFEKIFKTMKSEYNPNIVTYTSIINYYLKKNNLEKFNFYYNEMLSNNIKPNSVFYSTLINFFIYFNKPESVLLHYNNLKNLIVDSETYINVLLFFLKINQFENFENVYNDMKNNQCFLDIHSYNLIFSVLSKSKNQVLFQKYYDDMLLLKIKPNELTLKYFGSINLS
jgi:pentatricopeptide repeat protein